MAATIFTRAIFGKSTYPHSLQSARPIPRVPDRKHHAFYWSEHQILIFALTAARQIDCLGNVIILKRIRETDRFGPGVGKDRLQMRGEMLIGWVI